MSSEDDKRGIKQTAAQEAGAYFRGQKAFDRCFRLMRKKWESYGRAAGRVEMKDCTAQERRALEGLLGRVLPGKAPRFSLTEFETALSETRFGPVPLKDLLEAYFREALTTNKSKAEQEKQDKSEFITRMQRSLPFSDNWLADIGQQRSFGYQALMAEYNRSPENAEHMLCQVEQCLSILHRRQETEDPPIRLALLATEATGNPHALDRGKPLGQLLTHAFCYNEVCEFPGNAQELAALYFRCGIQIDEIASTVTVYGVHLETGAGLHPAYEGFLQRREPAVVTLANLSEVRRAYGDWSSERRVYVVENEMVFSHLLDALPGVPFCLLCTSGQPRTAAYVLLDLLKAEGVRIFYAGDLDPEGMGIADRIWRRYPKNVEIWHMAPEDYQISKSGELVDSRRLVMLQKLEHPVLRRTAELLLKEKVAGYQERLVSGLAGDIREER